MYVCVCGVCAWCVCLYVCVWCVCVCVCGVCVVCVCVVCVCVCVLEYVCVCVVCVCGVSVCVCGVVCVFVCGVCVCCVVCLCLCVCVCSLIFPTCKPLWIVVYRLSDCTVPYFPHYLIIVSIFVKRIPWKQNVYFDFLTKFVWHVSPSKNNSLFVLSWNTKVIM